MQREPLHYQFVRIAKQYGDLEMKLKEWERFYNYDRPHGAFGGKTPCEVLRSLLQQQDKCP